MKKIFTFIIPMLALASIAGCDDTKEPNEGDGYNITFEQGYIEYYWDEYGSGTGNFDLFFLKEGSDLGYGLYLECFSDYYEDALQAVMAPGKYTSADTYAEYTFSTDSDFEFYDKYSDEDYEITGGSFTVSRNNKTYTFSFDLILDDGRLLKGRYSGLLESMYESNIRSNVSLDSSAGVYAEPFSENSWGILMIGEDFDFDDYTGKTVILEINTESGTERLPAGNYSMAPAPGHAVRGTAEPSSWYEESWDPSGCWYIYYEDEEITEIAYSISSNGYVNISEPAGDGLYVIDFSFTDTNGHIVSGNYEGYVLHESDLGGRMKKKALHQPVKSTVRTRN